MSDIDQIINGDIDLYKYLEISPDANASTIRRKYRQKALLYHPDKNPDPEASTKFHLLSLIYEVLTNNELRTTYDNIRNYKQQRQQRLAELDEQTKRFKDQLISAENRSKRHQSFNELNKEQELERLKSQGLKKRKELEQKVHGIPDTSLIYKSYKDIPVVQYVNLLDEFPESNKVVVKWKHKPELGDLFNMDILKDIMTVFGPVINIQEIPNPEDKYRAALVEFQNYENVDRAINHNYKKSASLWDGTAYRKLASLLRECKKRDDFESHVSDEDLEVLSSFQREKGLDQTLLTDNARVNKFILSLATQDLQK